ncbi:unnamed protein product [Fraxinus pennsylvanica]|uniref:C2 domain-containing protein n=1 Tax=Fraxinus pennsylvanica TaxID=56036 RepID=A0AAD1YLI2_9LAMI|nr:unnamed protein product [Fraxinus pennsylvanica]
MVVAAAVVYGATRVRWVAMINRPMVESMLLLAGKRDRFHKVLHQLFEVEAWMTLNLKVLLDRSSWRKMDWRSSHIDPPKNGYEAEVTISSAKDLKNINWHHGKLRTYVVVWFDPKAKCSTKVDEEDNTCPYGDKKLVIPFNSPVEESTLYVDVMQANAAEDTKPLIGSSKFPLREVLEDVGFWNRLEKKLGLKRPSGRPQGKLEVNVTVR